MSSLIWPLLLIYLPPPLYSLVSFTSLTNIQVFNLFLPIYLKPCPAQGMPVPSGDNYYIFYHSSSGQIFV